jgi:hypothetical protein
MYKSGKDELVKSGKSVKALQDLNFTHPKSSSSHTHRNRRNSSEIRSYYPMSKGLLSKSSSRSNKSSRSQSSSSDPILQKKTQDDSQKANNALTKEILADKNQENNKLVENNKASSPQPKIVVLELSQSTLSSIFAELSKIFKPIMDQLAEIISFIKNITTKSLAKTQHTAFGENTPPASGYINNNNTENWRDHTYKHNSTPKKGKERKPLCYLSDGNQVPISDKKF